jgi:hypothetical protein
VDHRAGGVVVTAAERHTAVLTDLAQLSGVLAGAHISGRLTDAEYEPLAAVISGNWNVLKRHAPKDASVAGWVCGYDYTAWMCAITAWPCPDYRDAAAGLLPEAD